MPDKFGWLLFGLVTVCLINCSEELPSGIREFQQTSRLPGAPNPGPNPSANVPFTPIIPAKCVTSWGEEVPHNGQVNVFKNGEVDCPFTCGFEMQTCNNGNLVGTIAGGAQTCVVKPCRFKVVTINACPHSTQVLQTLNLTCRRAQLSNYACLLSALTGGYSYKEYRCLEPSAMPVPVTYPPPNLIPVLPVSGSGDSGGDSGL